MDVRALDATIGAIVALSSVTMRDRSKSLGSKEYGAFLYSRMTICDHTLHYVL